MGASGGSARSSRRPTSDELLAWRMLLQYVRSTLSELDAELRAVAGMDLDEYDVLVQLSEVPSGRLRMGELVAATLIARSSCTRVVEHLVRRRWVERSTPEDDRRVVVVTLTPAGRGALRRAAVVHLGGVAARFSAPLVDAGPQALPELTSALGTLLASAHQGR